MQKDLKRLNQKSILNLGVVALLVGFGAMLNGCSNDPQGKSSASAVGANAESAQGKKTGAEPVQLAAKPSEKGQRHSSDDDMIVLRASEQGGEECRLSSEDRSLGRSENDLPEYCFVQASAPN
jgi:hypothetical protein